MLDDQNDVFLPARRVWEFLGVTQMTLWRWTKDGRFPPPTRFGRWRYWRRSEVEAWVAEQPRTASLNDGALTGPLRKSPALVRPAPSPAVDAQPAAQPATPPAPAPATPPGGSAASGEPSVAPAWLRGWTRE
jgi:prophage regulatory protein